VELLLAQGNLSAEGATTTMPTLFTLVSNVQTTAGGGVDISIIKDEQDIGGIVHEEEADLSRLRSAIISTMDI